MHRLLLSILATIARATLRRQRTFIVGVTGSVGKTSTREAIRAVLARSVRVRSAPKNYNTEVGLPAAVLGVRAPDRSPVRWAAAIARGLRLALARDRAYPEVLVLEYGADHPGDLVRLVSIARPDVAVVSAVGPAHTLTFGSVERVAVEKRRLVEALPPHGLAVLNRDDERVAAFAASTRGRVVTFGQHADAEVRGTDVQVTIEAGIPTGIACKVLAGGSAVPIRLPGCLGWGHVAAALAAAAVGLSRGMHLIEISHALAGYTPPPSRMRLLPGVKRTTLIDDTYNASPLALAAALVALRDLPTSSRKIAVLGDMLELGRLTEPEHQKMGELAASFGLSHLVTVGEASRHLARGARDAGMSEGSVLEFRTTAEAGRFVQDVLQPGDVILVKGSQGMRMERIVVELMAEPLRARDLVCRQDEEWVRT